MKCIFSKITVILVIVAIVVSCSHRQNVKFVVNEHTGAVKQSVFLHQFLYNIEYSLNIL